MYTRSIITLFLIFSFLGSYSQVLINNENCKEAYDLILSLRFEEAEEIIDSERNNNPNNVYLDYLENQIVFLKVTLSENESYFDEEKENIDLWYNNIDKVSDTNPYKQYLLGNINLQLAINNLRFKNYTTGLWQVNRSYRLLTKNKKEFPDFFPNNITLGVLHIMIGIVPDSYDWILKIISMNGSVQQGREELKSSLQSCETNPEFKYLSKEILFYITMIDLSLSADPDYARFIVSKTNSYASEDLLMTYLTANIYMKNGENDSAIQILDNIDTSINFYPFYYLEYLKGECNLRQLNTKSAIEHYNNFINNFSGVNYLKDAYLKISWAHLIDKDSVNYIKSINKIDLIGETNLDADKVAQEIFENNTEQNTELIKARLLFDGGYYTDADSVLININKNELSVIEKVELLYRQARTYELLNDLIVARKFYKKTIEAGKDADEYYAGNSALKLGNIYEKQADTNQAIYYYNICLDLDFTQYRNSIKGKAKQGLNRLTSDQ